MRLRVDMLTAVCVSSQRVRELIQILPVLNLHGQVDAGKTYLCKFALAQYGAVDVAYNSPLILKDRSSEAAYRFHLADCAGMVVVADDPGLSAADGQSAFSIQLMHEVADGRLVTTRTNGNQDCVAGLIVTSNHHVLEGLEKPHLLRTLTRLYVMPAMESKPFSSEETKKFRELLDNPQHLFRIVNLFDFLPQAQFDGTLDAFRQEMASEFPKITGRYAKVRARVAVDRRLCPGISTHHA